MICINSIQIHLSDIISAISTLLAVIAIGVSIWSNCQSKRQFQCSLEEQTRALNYSLYEKRLELLHGLGKLKPSIEDIKDSLYNLIDKREEELKLLFSQEIFNEYIEVKELGNKEYRLQRNIDCLRHEVIDKKGTSIWEQLEDAKEKDEAYFELLSKNVCSGCKYDYFSLAKDRNNLKLSYDERMKVLLSNMSSEIINSINESTNREKTFRKGKTKRGNK